VAHRRLEESHRVGARSINQSVRNTAFTPTSAEEEGTAAVPVPRTDVRHAGGGVHGGAEPAADATDGTRRSKLPLYLQGRRRNAAPAAAPSPSPASLSPLVHLAEDVDPSEEPGARRRYRDAVDEPSDGDRGPLERAGDDPDDRRARFSRDEDPVDAAAAAATAMHSSIRTAGADAVPAAFSRPPVVAVPLPRAAGQPFTAEAALSGLDWPVLDTLWAAVSTGELKHTDVPVDPLGEVVSEAQLQVIGCACVYRRWRSLFPRGISVWPIDRSCVLSAAESVRQRPVRTR
jgi:hypothetical protein